MQDFNPAYVGCRSNCDHPSIAPMSACAGADIGPDLAGYRDGSECATVEQSCLGSRSSNTATGYEL